MKFIRNSNSLVQSMISCGNYIINSNGTIVSKVSKRKVGYVASSGYCMVKFHNKHIQIHRLIWEVYGDKPLDDTLVINHKNGIKTDNRIENLELIPHSENLKHKYRILKCPAVIGHKKITKAIADEIRKLRSEGWTYRMLMNKYNVGKTTISYIINNKIWKDGGVGLSHSS